MSQHSSPDVQPMRDTQYVPAAAGGAAAAGAAAPTQGTAGDCFMAGYCEAKRYKVLELIGRGSYGTVCAAWDTFTNQKVAIKNIKNVFDNVADATRILREIKLLRLLKHPDVVEIKHIMLPSDPRKFKDIYVVFELLESDLHTVIGANDDLTQDHHRVFLYQLLRGLNFIHQCGVLHRDLKPKNILANSNCKLKICDFGLARPLVETPTVQAWTDYVATRWYRAPELCGCFYARYSQAVDVWSIGCIFAEVMLGKPLFPGRDAASQLHLITDLLGKPGPHSIARIANYKARAFLQHLPERVARDFQAKFPTASPPALRLLKRLLSFDPNERPTAAQALADPYFKDLPNATVQEAAPVTSQQFDFESRQLDETMVRALIYQEILNYHPAVAAAYQTQTLHAPLLNPFLTAPGGDVDIKRQFMLAESSASQGGAAAQHPAAAAAMHGSNGSNGSNSSSGTTTYSKQQVASTGMPYASEGVMTVEQQQAVLSYEAAQKLYHRQVAAQH